MDGYNLGVKDYGRSEESFDWVSFVKRPLVIVKMINILFSIIVFGCISSQGWHYVPASHTNSSFTPASEVCLINGSSSTCTFSTGLAVLAFLASLALVYLEVVLHNISPVKTRRQYIKADFYFSGLLSFLFFFSFCDLAHNWKLSVGLPGGTGTTTWTQPSSSPSCPSSRGGWRPPSAGGGSRTRQMPT